MGDAETSTMITMNYFISCCSEGDGVETLNSENLGFPFVTDDVAEWASANFLAVIEKTSLMEKIGLELSDARGKCRVVDVRPEGLVHEWNIQNPGKQIMVGDQILNINGVSDPADIRRLCGKMHSLRVRVLRGSACSDNLHGK